MAQGRLEKQAHVHPSTTHNHSHMVAEPGASQIVDVLVPLIMEEIVKAVNAVPRERIAQRICEQIVDVGGSQVAEQDTEAPKTSSRDRTLQRAVEQIPDVLCRRW